jgi:hypothetical protein
VLLLGRLVSPLRVSLASGGEPPDVPPLEELLLLDELLPLLDVIPPLLDVLPLLEFGPGSEELLALGVGSMVPHAAIARHETANTSSNSMVGKYIRDSISGQACLEYLYRRPASSASIPTCRQSATINNQTRRDGCRYCNFLWRRNSCTDFKRDASIQCEQVVTGAEWLSRFYCSIVNIKLASL